MTNQLFIEIENVARWLENGCDVAHAARELRLIAAKVRPDEPKADLGGCNIACRRCGKETTLRYTDSSKTRVSTDSITGWTYDTENGAQPFVPVQP